jgi:hypothetical protein
MRKRWLLLLLIPLGLAAIPVLLFGMLLGTRLLSIVVGPVNIFNTPRHAPRAGEMAGYYRLSKEARRAPRGAKLSERSGFRLDADHRFEMTDVPSFGEFGEQPNCYYDVAGKWGLRDDGEGVILYLTMDELTPAPGDRPLCAPAGLYGVFEVLGHSRPYRIWYGIGDPDSDEGLTYVLQGK